MNATASRPAMTRGMTAPAVCEPAAGRDWLPVADRAGRANAARRSSGRRRSVDPTTCDRDYSAAELEFLAAIEGYKRASGRMFPTWSEVLEVVRDLGYQKAGA